VRLRKISRYPIEAYTNGSRDTDLEAIVKYFLRWLTADAHPTRYALKSIAAIRTRQCDTLSGGLKLNL